jgi:hypothetical protein
MITMYEMIMTNASDANACLTPRGVTYPKMVYLFKQVQVTTYSSQVTENHPTSTGLSKLSIFLTANTRVTMIGYKKGKQGIMQQRLHSTPIT